VYRIGDGAAHLHIWFFARPVARASDRAAIDTSDRLDAEITEL
jgi:hypothetical protein